MDELTVTLKAREFISKMGPPALPVSSAKPPTTKPPTTKPWAIASKTVLWVWRILGAS